jgi:hypothetical protein
LNQALANTSSAKALRKQQVLELHVHERKNVKRKAFFDFALVFFGML